MVTMQNYPHTLVDLDFLIRLADTNSNDERLVSASVLKAEFSEFYNHWVDRAYWSDEDEYTCKLRRGIRVTFVKR